MNNYPLTADSIDDMTAASLRTRALLSVLRNYWGAASGSIDVLNDDVLDGLAWQIEENMTVIDDGLSAAIDSRDQDMLPGSHRTDSIYGDSKDVTADDLKAMSELLKSRQAARKDKVRAV